MTVRDTIMPPRIASLPEDARGYPIPWFVHPVDPIDFRVLRVNALYNAWQKETCWICGQPLGVYKVYVVGVLSAIQRASSEPACHRDCAEYAIQVCPFIVNPNMRRSPRDLPEGTEVREDLVKDNPGLFLLWITKEPYRELVHNYLKLPPWKELVWYRERRRATREEVMNALWRGADRLRHAMVDAPTRKKFEGFISEMHKLVPKE